MSSTKRKRCVNLEALGRSFIYSMKNKGPKIEPRGTPHLMVYFGEPVRLNSTNCWRPEKWLLRWLKTVSSTFQDLDLDESL